MPPYREQAQKPGGANAEIGRYVSPEPGAHAMRASLGPPPSPSAPSDRRRASRDGPQRRSLEGVASRLAAGRTREGVAARSQAAAGPLANFGYPERIPWKQRRRPPGPRLP